MTSKTMGLCLTAVLRVIVIVDEPCLSFFKLTNFISARYYKDHNKRQKELAARWLDNLCKTCNHDVVHWWFED